jgi:hypothetical protein
MLASSGRKDRPRTSNDGVRQHVLLGTAQRYSRSDGPVQQPDDGLDGRPGLHPAPPPRDPPLTDCAEYPSVAFLFLDRDGNGTPDDGSDLFGDHTLLADGQTARHGFEALAELDSNHDGSISAADERWPELRLWQDANRDGTAQLDELTPLNAWEVSALNLNVRWTGRRDRYGNAFRWRSTATFGDGHAKPPRAYYDVYSLRPEADRARPSTSRTPRRRSGVPCARPDRRADRAARAGSSSPGRDGDGGCSARRSRGTAAPARRRRRGTRAY